MSIEKIGLDHFRPNNPKTSVEQFSEMSKGLVCQHALECKEGDVLPTYSSFESWMNKKSDDLTGISDCFLDECYSSYLLSYLELRNNP